MSRPSSAGSAVVLIFVLLLAGIASLVALPGGTGTSPPPGATQESATGQEPTFHAPVPPPPYPGEASFCSECHTGPPHEGEGVGPAFFNDHAAFIDCLLCHWTRISGEPPEPTWRKRDDGFMILGLSPSGGETIDGRTLRDDVVKKQSCFDRGLSCSSCHSRDGMTPYVKPGLSPQGQAALEDLPEFFTISKGTKWYFPQRQ